MPHLPQFTLSAGRALLFCLILLPESRGEEPPSQYAETAPGGPPSGIFGGDLEFRYEYVGESGFRGESGERQSARLFETGFAYRFPVRENILVRAGLRYRAHTFSSTGLALPENLYSVSAPLTFTILRERRPLYIATLTPGLGFEDSMTSEALHASFLGFRTFRLRENLSVQLALFGSTDSKYPILPGAGLVWRFGETGTLRLTPPRPEIVFAPSEKWEAAFGGSYRRSSFRVSEKDGIPKNARLNLTEFRTGARLARRLTENLEVTAEAGWVIKRKFDHHRIGVVHRTRGAPYGSLALTSSF